MLGRLFTEVVGHDFAGRIGAVPAADEEHWRALDQDAMREGGLV